MKKQSDRKQQLRHSRLAKMACLRCSALHPRLIFTQSQSDQIHPDSATLQWVVSWQQRSRNTDDSICIRQRPAQRTCR